MTGFDIDGTLRPGFVFPAGSVVISGRTFAEYDDFAKSLAQQVPVYIRGSGQIGDRHDAAEFKARMIAHLGVTTYYEDDAEQAATIRRLYPGCSVVPV